MGFSRALLWLETVGRDGWGSVVVLSRRLWWIARSIAAGYLSVGGWWYARGGWLWAFGGDGGPKLKGDGALGGGVWVWEFASTTL